MLHPIDIITRNNKITGKLSDPEDATNRGLWHRGVHAIIITPTGDFLVQRRAADAIQHPGMVDIGVGGFVDARETPEHAIIREINEETGLKVTQDQLVFLGTSRYNHNWHFGEKRKISRVVLYNYAVRLHRSISNVAPQSTESEWIGFIPRRSALWLVHHGSIRSIGKLVPIIAYYRKLLKLTTKFIHV
jgi:8-oxo-dGTP pyrophosphatase MutT (NUDIX family)